MLLSCGYASENNWFHWVMKRTGRNEIWYPHLKKYLKEFMQTNRGKITRCPSYRNSSAGDVLSSR